MEIVVIYPLLIVPCYIKLMSKKVTKIYWIKARKVSGINSNVSQLGLNSWIKLRQLERVQTLGKADFAEVTSLHTQGKHQTKRMIFSYFFLILKSFSFVICWPNSEEIFPTRAKYLLRLFKTPIFHWSLKYKTAKSGAKSVVENNTFCLFLSASVWGLAP